jgi:hypothetical protein
VEIRLLEELSVQEEWDLKEFLGKHRIGEPEEEQE